MERVDGVWTAAWTIGGDFVLGDPDDEGAPVVSITFHEPMLRTMMVDRLPRESFFAALAKIIKQVPHPHESAAREAEREE